MLDGWWLPPAISHHATAHDIQFVRTLFTTVAIFVVGQCALAAMVWRYRSSVAPARGNREDSGPKSSRIELVCTGATAILFIGLLAMGAKTWAGVQFTAAPGDAEVVEVLAKQFAWSFRYSGPDRRFGRTSLTLMDDAAGNPFGLVDADSYGKDDIVSATLRIPVGRPVNLALRSIDVVHSLFIRELRIKQDLVPGMQIPLHFQAGVPGTFEVPCAELCGLGHHQMRTTVIVMPPDEFDAWKQRQVR